jgi:integrase
MRKASSAATNEDIRGLWEREPGSGIWWIRYRDADGKLRREKVGSRSAAKALLDKRRVARRLGEKLPESIRTAPIKFEEIANSAKEHVEKHNAKPQTVLHRIDEWIKAFGAKPAESVTPEEIDKWLHRKDAATANRYKDAISICYREAIRNGKLKSNPARLVKRRRESSGVIRFLKKDEEALVRQIIQERFPDKMPELDVAIGTGMRAGEQFGPRLTWGQVDFDRCEITLKQTKNGTSRVIPLNATVVAALTARRALVPKSPPSAPVFPTSPRYWWDDVRIAAKIPDYRWHDHRHTFCSRLAMAGVNLVVIKELAGHKTLTVTARYAHLDDSAKRKAVDLLVV